MKFFSRRSISNGFWKTKKSKYAFNGQVSPRVDSVVLRRRRKIISRRGFKPSNERVVMLFTGSVRVRVLEARHLRPTEWSRRFSQNEAATAAIDSYVNVDWDEYPIGKTQVRPKTNEPRWNEEFTASGVHQGKAIGFSVFHSCVMPPDDFVANTRIAFDELKIGSANDIWVDLEPHGQLHVIVEMHGTNVEAEHTEREALGED
ncbi:hypothetical protein L5515_007686 [Caenorhabditis briggsae]|uniref:C2 domain-containing protein n=1 Tax=Caenorhabditis briggsae TaxID=6238 RepID=A0AAE9EZ56_CAEBR|nr:hypothetical protein L5515_007686 [Caenorhabditis briggsae]